MKISLRIIAYFCIATTPIQILIVLWGILVVLTSDYGFMSLSQIEFINNYLTFLLPLQFWHMFPNDQSKITIYCALTFFPKTF